MEINQLKEQLLELGNKYVIKPVRQGSSVGVCIVSTPQEAIEAAQKTFMEFGDCMIEEFISGREITAILHPNIEQPCIFAIRSPVISTNDSGKGV